jgi:hypothetical protein
METLPETYRMARNHDGAPGIDGVTFGAIEESGVENFLKSYRLMGAFVISPLPSMLLESLQTAGFLRSIRIYQTSSLLRTSPPPFRREIGGERNRITGDTGKPVEGESHTTPLGDQLRRSAPG